MEEIIKEIKLTGYLTNKKIGGFFHVKYPYLYKKILNLTKDIENTYVVNTTLRSRVIFLLNYNCDIENIRYGEKWLTFDRKKDDFIKKSINSTKKGWDDKFNQLVNVEVLPLSTTISKLKDLTDNGIFGKGKNRTLLSTDPVLYKSIEFYSRDLKILNRPSNKFPSKIIFIRDYEGKLENLKCNLCNNSYCLYNEQKKSFNNTCKKCYLKSVPKYPQKEWFIINYGKDWLKYYTEDRERIKSFKVNSKKWFIEKYGTFEGTRLRKNYIQDKVENIIALKDNGVSQISQELFWEVYNRLPDKTNCYFHDLNKELIIREEDVIYFPDFVYNNKIIEYDGIYWHDEDKDKKRNEFYKKIGYKLFIINSDQFNRNKKDEKIITECLNFLLDEK